MTATTANVVSLRMSPDQKKKLDGKLQEGAKKIAGAFERHYQRWYTESLAVIKQLMPDRLQEFRQLYHGSKG
jgi:hypothetical protein